MSGRFGQTARSLAQDAQIEIRPMHVEARGGRNRMSGYVVLMDGKELGQLQREPEGSGFRFVSKRGKDTGFRGSPRQFQTWIKEQMRGGERLPRVPKKPAVKDCQTFDKWTDEQRRKAAESRRKNANSHPKPEGTRFSHLRAPAPRPGRKTRTR